jgi:AcrR family transcriptional regulator
MKDTYLAPRPRISRADKAIANRRRLIAAAAEVIGEVGYEQASIARITERAGLAHGTFYRHFASQQDLFDQLLPEVGNNLLETLRKSVSGSQNFLELEERGFRAIFDYFQLNPGFYRLVNEAEVAAPKAFRHHFDNIAQHFVRALRKARSQGETPSFSDRELEVVAMTLMASRYYLYLRFVKSEGGSGPVPDWVVRAYMKLVSFGIRGREDDNKRGIAGARSKANKVRR